MNGRSDKLEKTFEKTLARLTENAPEPSFLVALSGGCDSTALLLLTAGYCRRRGGSVYAMHVHHGLRQEEADRDEAFCRALCEKTSVGFSCAHVDVPAYAEKEKTGVEEAARALRYGALEKEASKTGAYILTAHHEEDQLETVLFRIVRGCGGAGLAGIPEKRGNILRPLLSASREELEKYNRARGQDWVTDSTNADENYARNKIRRAVLPALKEICPQAGKNASALARSAGEDEEYLKSLLPDGPLNANGLENLPPPLRKRYIARAYGEYCRETLGREPMPEGAHLQAANDLIDRRAYGKSLSLPGGVKMTFCRAGLRFSPDKTPPREYELPLFAGENRLPDGETSVYLMKKERFSEFWAKNVKIHNLFTKVAINSATISGELAVRSRRAGDTVRTGGMTHSLRKTVAAVCADTEKRKSYPVVCDGQGILWVPGCAPRDGCGAKEDPDENTLYILMGVTGYGIS